MTISLDVAQTMLTALGSPVNQLLRRMFVGMRWTR